jgi:uncharacterized protein
MKPLTALALAIVTLTLLVPPVHAADPAGDIDWKGGTLTFLGLIRDGKNEDAAAYFDDNVSKMISSDDLGKFWTKMQEQVGPFKAFGTPRVTLKEKLHVVDVPTKFEWQPLTISVAWSEDGAVAGFRVLPAAPNDFPSDEKPSLYPEEKVTVGADPWALPGTLTLPKSGTASYPAVILVHGSGPNDRDETIGANKPFREIAEGLAAEGIAVLRYDKRTRVHGAKMDAKSITVDDEVLQDVNAAIALLKTKAQIDPKRIYVVGHSLGALLAPLVATQNPDLGGIAMLAGAARPLGKVLVDQLAYIGSVSADTAAVAAIAEMRKEAEQALAPTAPDSVMIMGMTVAYLRDLDRRDVVGAASKLTMPVFVVQGGRDYQATQEDFDLWKTALAGNPKAGFKLYPDLDHLFHKGTAKARPEDYMKPGTVSPELIQDLAGWIRGAAK